MNSPNEIQLTVVLAVGDSYSVIRKIIQFHAEYALKAIEAGNSLALRDHDLRIFSPAPANCQALSGGNSGDVVLQIPTEING